MIQTIKYTTEGIVITIPCATPGATHENLLRALLTGIKGHLHDESKTPADAERIEALVELLQTTLPSEQQLRKSYE